MRQDRYLTLRPWGLLPRTIMGSTTWRAMCGSGAGIGMGLTRREARPTRVEPRRAPAGCIAAAAGTAAPAAAEWRAATAAARRARTTASGSGCSAVWPPRAAASGAIKNNRENEKPHH